MSDDTPKPPRRPDPPPLPDPVEALPTPAVFPPAPALPDGTPNGLLARNPGTPPELFLELLNAPGLSNAVLAEKIAEHQAKKPGRPTGPPVVGPVTPGPVVPEPVSPTGPGKPQDNVDGTVDSPLIPPIQEEDVLP